MPKPAAAKQQKSISSIADLTADPKNARRRTERSSWMLHDSLQRFGAARSIVIDEDGRVLAGNGTVEAAGQVGINRVQVVDADGDTIIAVRRTGLSEVDKVQLALADNRTADLAEWDVEVLAELGKEVDLQQFWKPEELQQLVDDLQDASEALDELAAQSKPREIQCVCPNCGHEFVKEG